MIADINQAVSFVRSDIDNIEFMVFRKIFIRNLFLAFLHISILRVQNPGVTACFKVVVDKVIQWNLCRVCSIFVFCVDLFRFLSRAHERSCHIYLILPDEGVLCDNGDEV
jgi:hypothetical protein